MFDKTAIFKVYLSNEDELKCNFKQALVEEFVLKIACVRSDIKILELIPLYIQYLKLAMSWCLLWNWQHTCWIKTHAGGTKKEESRQKRPQQLERCPLQIKQHLAVKSMIHLTQNKTQNTHTKKTSTNPETHTLPFLITSRELL